MSEESDTGVPAGVEHPMTTLAYLRAEIARLVRLLENGDRSRTLCQLQFKWNIDPVHFRRLLREAGLRASRISEILRVIESPDVCEALVSENITWKQSLEMAWNQKLGELERVGAKLCRLIRQHLDDWAPPVDWDRVDCSDSPEKWLNLEEEWLSARETGGWTLRLESGVLRWEKDGAKVEFFDTALEITLA